MNLLDENYLYNRFLLESTTSDFRKKYGEDKYKLYVTNVLGHKEQFTPQELDMNYWLGKSRTSEELDACINRVNNVQEQFIQKFGNNLFKWFTRNVVNETTQLVHNIADPETGELMDSYRYWLNPSNNKSVQDLEEFLNELNYSYYTKEYVNGQYSDVYKSSNYIIRKIDTFPASFYFGKATGWCTSGRYLGMGQEYADKEHPWEPDNRSHWNSIVPGKQFYFIYHLKEPKVTMHYASSITGECFDETDYQKYALLVYKSERKIASITEAASDTEVDVEEYFKDNNEVLSALINNEILDRDKLLEQYPDLEDYIDQFIEAEEIHISNLNVDEISLPTVKLYNEIKDKLLLNCRSFWLRNKGMVLKRGDQKESTHYAVVNNAVHNNVLDYSSMPIILCLKLFNNNLNLSQNTIYKSDRDKCQYIETSLGKYLLIKCNNNFSYAVRNNYETRNLPNKFKNEIFTVINYFIEIYGINCKNILLEKMNNIPKYVQKILMSNNGDGISDYLSEKGVDLNNSKYIKLDNFPTDRDEISELVRSHPENVYIILYKFGNTDDIQALHGSDSYTYIPSSGITEMGYIPIDDSLENKKLNRKQLLKNADSYKAEVNRVKDKKYAYYHDDITPGVTELKADPTDRNYYNDASGYTKIQPSNKKNQNIYTYIKIWKNKKYPIMDTLKKYFDKLNQEYDKNFDILANLLQKNPPSTKSKESMHNYINCALDRIASLLTEYYNDSNLTFNELYEQDYKTVSNDIARDDRYIRDAITLIKTNIQKNSVLIKDEMGRIGNEFVTYNTKCNDLLQHYENEVNIDHKDDMKRVKEFNIELQNSFKEYFTELNKYNDTDNFSQLVKQNQTLKDLRNKFKKITNNISIEYDVEFDELPF